MVSIVHMPQVETLSDTLPVLSDGVRRYTCRTYREDFSAGKREARNRVVRIVNENPALGPGPNGALLHALTLPGPWWHFENALLHRRHFYFTGVEASESLFRLAAMRMPRGATSEDPRRFYAAYHHKQLGCPVVRGLGHKLLNCDVHSYIRATEHEFGLVWLDLMSPISRRVLYSVVAASSRMRGDGSTFAITVQAAREQIAMLMEMGGAENRLDFIGDVTRALLGPTFHEVSRFRYSDGAPMAQFVFVRQDSARKPRTVRALRNLIDSIRASYERLPPTAARPFQEAR